MDNLDAYGGYKGRGGGVNMYAFIQNNQICDMEGQFYEDVFGIKSYKYLVNRVVLHLKLFLNWVDFVFMSNEASSS